MRLPRSAVAALAGLTLAPATALACSCSLGRDYSALRREASALFVGVVEAGRPSAALFRNRNVGRLRVLRTWKGAQADLIAVGIPLPWDGCGGYWDSIAGDTVLVLAWRDRLGLVTTPGCALWPASTEERVAAALGPGATPKRRVHLAHLWFWGPWYLLAGAAAGAGGLLARRWRARGGARDQRPN